MLPLRRHTFLERLKGRFSMYRMHHKTSLLLYQDSHFKQLMNPLQLKCHSVSKAHFVKSQVSPTVTIAVHQAVVKASPSVSKRSKINKQQSRRNTFQNNCYVNMDTVPKHNMHVQQIDDYPYSIDCIEHLLYFDGNEGPVLPVLDDREILEFFKKM